MEKKTNNSQYKRALLSLLLTASCLFGAHPVIAAPACKLVLNDSKAKPAVSQNETSRAYLQTADWLTEVLRTFAVIIKDSNVHMISFGEPAIPSKGKITKAMLEQYGAVPEANWNPKKDIQDPRVINQITVEIEKIAKEYISELNNAYMREQEAHARLQVEKKVLALFEKKFGKFSEKTIGDSELAQRLTEIRKPIAAAKPMPQLSPHQQSLLKKHPLYKWAQEFKDQGKSIDFFSGFFTSSEMIRQNLYKGERSQALFLKKILSELFPRAGFVGAGYKPVEGKGRVPIFIGDLSEAFAGNPSRIRRLDKKGATLPMNLGKAANLREGRKDKKEVRQELGLPADRHIVHMYVRSEDTLTSLKGSSQFRNLLEAMDKFHPLDIVIVTFGNHAEGFTFDTSGVTSSFTWGGRQTVSGLQNGVDLRPRTLIENNTVGKVIDLHNAADYSVIVGPVNFFEPLNVGTPTLLIAKTSAEQPKSDYGTYDKDTLMDYAELAAQSGIFRALEISRMNQDYTPATQLLKELSRAKESPVRISDIAFEKYLDALYRHLVYQMFQFNADDYGGLNFP